MKFHPTDAEKQFLFVSIGNFIVRIDLHKSSHVMDNVLLNGFFGINKNEKGYQEALKMNENLRTLGEITFLKYGNVLSWASIKEDSWYSRALMTDLPYIVC
jgi:hypothetical protein